MSKFDQPAPAPKGKLSTYLKRLVSETVGTSRREEFLNDRFEAFDSPELKYRQLILLWLDLEADICTPETLRVSNPDRITRMNWFARRRFMRHFNGRAK